MTTYTLKSASVAQPCDGAFGFSDGTADYIVGGWAAGPVLYKTFWKSTNGGTSFVQQSDFAYPAHTSATCIANGVGYYVGGDYYNKLLLGDYDRSSHKCEAGTWSLIAADCGIVNRTLAALAFLDDAFYLVGGQTEFTKDTAYNTVMRSDDGCETFSVILADTTPYFKGGLHWGAVVTYQGELWKIGGGIYDHLPSIREYSRAMFSSVDGITWTYRGQFRGHGRHYQQCVVFNDRIWVICGYNGYHGSNLSEIWTVQKLSSGRIVQTYIGVPDFAERHAPSCWVNAAGTGILVFGGSKNDGVTGECWLITA